MGIARLKDRKILIVDDDEDVLGSIDLAMRTEGARTITVVDGNAAVHMVHADPPEVVILDMMLPKRSGFLVLEKIMEVEDPPIVVMITANRGKRHMAYAEALGVAAYLVKPVPLQRLIDTVARLIEERENGEPPADAEEE
jgi:DNA-binding response OmpR family regulator